MACKTMQKRLTSRNELFNRSTFDNSETTNELITSKHVEKWSQILIWSLGWPCTKNETTLIGNLALKSVIFRMSPNIGQLYVILKHVSLRVKI